MGGFIHSAALTRTLLNAISGCSKSHRLKGKELEKSRNSGKFASNQAYLNPLILAVVKQFQAC